MAGRRWQLRDCHAPSRRMAGAHHARAGARRRPRGGVGDWSGILNSRRGWLLCSTFGVLAALLLLAWILSGGHPWRMFIGVVHGPEALAYLPPRHEVSLAPGPPQPTLSLAE